VTAVAKKVFDEALSLPVETRVRLVEKLLISLNLPTRPEIDRLWSKEVERRISQIDKRRSEIGIRREGFRKYP